MAQPLAINARDYVFQVSTAGVTYTTISGIQNWGFKPTYKTADAGTIADGGWGKELTMGAVITFNLEGLYLEDSTDGTRDAGQAIVDTASGLFGVAGLYYFKITHTGTGYVTDVLTFRGAVQLTDQGGKENDLAPWGAQITSYGKPTGTGQWAVLFP